MSGAPSGPGTVRSSDVTLGLGGISMAASSCDVTARRSTMSGMVLKPPGIAWSSWSRGSRTSGSIRSRRDMNPPSGSSSAVMTDAECILRSDRARINARSWPGRTGPAGGRAERPGMPGPQPVARASAAIQRGYSTRSHRGAARQSPVICGLPQEGDMARYPTDHAGLEILPFDRCLQLLTTVPVGRISFFADGEIVVLPVNHVVDGQDPVFCTARGSKLSAAEGQNLVAFEADDDAEIQRLRRLGLHPWVTAVERPFWIRIRPDSVSGRQTPVSG